VGDGLDVGKRKADVGIVLFAYRSRPNHSSVDHGACRRSIASEIHSDCAESTAS